MSKEISLETARKLVDNYIDVFTDEELADYMNAALDSSPGMAMLIWSAVTSRDQEVKINLDRILALHKNVNTAKFVELARSMNCTTARDPRNYRYFRHVGEAAKLIDGFLALDTFEDGKTTALKDGSLQGLLSVSSELR